jgi:hypothetical protein
LPTAIFRLAQLFRKGFQLLRCHPNQNCSVGHGFLTPSSVKKRGKELFCVDLTLGRRFRR